MKIGRIPFSAIDWNAIPIDEQPGETGTARIRTVEQNGIRIRRVEYSRNYRADHWCEKGHIVHILNGSLTIDLKDGRSETLSEGMSFIVGDGIDAHLARIEQGATILIVD